MFIYSAESVEQINNRAETCRVVLVTQLNHLKLLYDLQLLDDDPFDEI